MRTQSRSNVGHDTGRHAPANDLAAAAEYRIRRHCARSIQPLLAVFCVETAAEVIAALTKPEQRLIAPRISKQARLAGTLDEFLASLGLVEIAFIVLGRGGVTMSTLTNKNAQRWNDTALRKSLNL